MVHNVLLLASAVIASAIGGCPKPVHHVKHKPDAPLCSCSFIEPRTIILQAPEPTPEPGEVSIVRYYVPFTSDVPVSYESGLPPFDIWGTTGGMVYVVNPTTTTIVVRSPEVTKCPELDPNSLGAGLTLLAGGIAMIRSGKRL